MAKKDKKNAARIKRQWVWHWRSSIIFSFPQTNFMNVILVLIYKDLTKVRPAQHDVVPELFQFCLLGRLSAHFSTMSRSFCTLYCFVVNRLAWLRREISKCSFSVSRNSKGASQKRKLLTFIPLINRCENQKPWAHPYQSEPLTGKKQHDAPVCCEKQYPALLSRVAAN